MRSLSGSSPKDLTGREMRERGGVTFSTLPDVGEREMGSLHVASAVPPSLDHRLLPLHFERVGEEIPIMISISVPLFYEKNAKKSFFFAKKLQTQDTTLPFLLPILEKNIFKTSFTICYRINSVFHVFLAHFLG